MTELRTLAFGELEHRVWGAAWLPDPAGTATAVLGGGGEDASVAGLALSVIEEAGEWRLEGERVSLTVSAASEAVQVASDSVGGFDQLCRAAGRFALDGAEHAVDCLGLRSARTGEIELERLDSIRVVSGWFEPDEGLALVALRPRKAKAHDSDQITAAVVGGEGTVPVEDPRLSTTYSGEGWPIRAGLEMWIAGENDEHHPRRASGEAAGPRAQAIAGELELRGELFRWHSRGRDGAGVYALLRRR